LLDLWIRKNKPVQEGFFRSAIFRWAFIILNATQVLIQSGFVVGFIVLDANLPSRSYNVDIIILASFSFLICLASFIFGVWVFFLIRKNIASTVLRRMYFLKTIGITLVLTICFAERAIFFSYRLITSALIQESIFVVFAYLIPDLVPSIVMLGIVIFQRKSQLTREFEKFVVSTRLDYSAYSPIGLSESKALL